MENEDITTFEGVDGKPAYDAYLPGPIQVLVEWILLLLSTLFSFLAKKE